jgi:integrase
MTTTLTQAAVEKLRPDPIKRRIIRDAASVALFLVIHPTGRKVWTMRWRRSGAGEAKLMLGPVDLSRSKAPRAELSIGQPLTLVEARQLAAKINAERAAGRDVLADHRAEKHRRRVAIVEAAENNFAAAVKDFITDHAKPKNRNWREVARRLGLTDELEMRPRGLAERWRERDVRSIDASELFAIIEESRRFGIPGVAVRHEKPLETRAHKVHSALSSLFGWLSRRRRVAVNPMTSLHAPLLSSDRDRVLTSAEIAAFWAATEAVTEPFASVLKLLLITGARRSEISELRWEEVSEDAGVITIPGTRTKNRLPFVIYLPPAARQLIARRERGGTFVFSTTSGITPISGWSKVKKRLDARMKEMVPRSREVTLLQPGHRVELKSKEPLPSWRIHDLRRSAATHMAEAGIALPHIVEALLNHVSGHRASVAGVYNRAVYAAEKRAALELWAAHLEGIVCGEKKVVPIRGGQ